MKRSARTRLRRDLTRDMDRLCREVIFRRAGFRCEKCGKSSSLQWCHVYSRRYKSVRWDLDNSFCGCAGCHLWWHHKPLEAAEWWRSRIGETRAQDLRFRSQSWRGTDVEAVRLMLEQELKRLRGAS